MAGRVEGKVALVTGAARGQGRSHALRLAEEGADIIAVDICEGIASNDAYPLATEADLAETVRLVESADRRIVSRKADVRDRGQLAAAVADGVAELGRLDVVVANAGICPQGNPDVTSFLDVVAVNLGGVITTVEVALPHLADGASIIATGSIAGMMNGTTDNPTSGPGGAGYTHAKRGVARFVHDLALQLAPRQIRVNAVHPTNVETPMLLNDVMYKVFRPDLGAPTLQDAEVTMGFMHPMGVPYVQPSDISNAVLFLASDESRYVTGLQMKVDAGSLLRATTSGAPA
jgi:SDR family mycofactocin-dependent oxidoreductase